MKKPSRQQPPAAQDDDDLPVPSFLPMPATRRDGWTAERQTGFIRALATSGCVTEACRHVGMSQSSAYDLRARPHAVSFRNAWDTAIDFSMRCLTDVVVSRAINGVSVPIFFQGQQIGERRWYDNRLATFLLRYHDPLRYGAQHDRVTDVSGHSEYAALKLATAITRTREDAELTLNDIVARTQMRIRQLLKEELEVEDDPFPNNEDEEAE